MMRLKDPLCLLITATLQKVTGVDQIGEQQDHRSGGHRIGQRSRL
jgi:hypothetical protein